MGVGAGDPKEGKAKPLYRELSLFVVFVSSVHRRSVTLPVLMPMSMCSLSRRSGWSSHLRDI